jgi:polysaccharide biosynthesis transport protein
MTTLPQTSMVRMPRTGAPTQLAPAGVPMGMGAPPQPPQMTGADVWRVIRSNFWLIILSLIVFTAGGIGAHYYLLKHYPRFTSQALVQILPNLTFDPMATTPQMMDHTTIAIEQRTQAQLLKSERLLSEVMQKPAIRETAWFQGFGGNVQNVREELRDHLRVVPIPDTKLIRVEMTHRRPAGNHQQRGNEARIIVNEVVQQHLANRRSEMSQRQGDRQVQLNAMRQTYQHRRNQARDQMNAKAAQLSIDNMGVPGRMSGKELELSKLVEMQLGLRMNLNAARDGLETVQQQLQQGMDPASIEEYVERDQLVQQYKMAVHQLDVHMIEMEAKFGAEYPGVRMLRTRQEAHQRKLDELRNAALAKGRLMLVESMRQQVASNEKALEEVNTEIDRVKNELADLSNDMALYLTLKDEEKGYSEMLKLVEDELESIAQIQSAPDLGGIAWAARPEIPDRPSFPKLEIILPLAILLGLAFSLGIAFLRELMDTSVRSPRDIARIGQMNLLGMIPHEADDPQAGEARLPLVIFEAPHSMMAEQFRQARTRLQHTASLDTMRSMLVTSPSPGDGKTTVACNIAAGLALNGRRILLVDANFRRPELHRIFALNNERGFGDLLSNIEEFDSAVQETQVPNLSVLTSGPKPANSTELLESRLLIDFIERALEEYDHVVFDTAPLLFVADSVAMAPRVDGVISVVKARSSSRGLLQRMRDSLRQTKAEHVGVVLNGVRAQGGGYYGRNIRTYYEYQNGHGN